ncbi:HECT-domain ubiquitin-protein ligase E3 [Spraguea lophii 42_110]|uniref:HECT-type E3 ubiquitin transferase n=1 Tax=Spraguea lophii (strain 42_110) TaxID=1358809 RepID=S7W9M3_SPRLO|nr:HECT-domain ubiquitin-protein ligase E3 [Spraguea lophii 42_110]
MEQKVSHDKPISEASKELVDKYIRQLYIGCINSNKCVGIFCRKNTTKSTLVSLASTLALYGEIFLCENISIDNKFNHKHYAHNNITRSSPLLDFYLCVVEKVGKCDCSLNMELDNKMEKKGVYEKTVIDTNTCSTHTKQTSSLTDIHNFCIFLENKKFLYEDIILLEGIFYLLIKYRKYSSCILLERIIMRIFYIILTTGIEIKEEYYMYINELFLDIQRIYKELKSDLNTNCNNINYSLCNIYDTNSLCNDNNDSNSNSGDVQKEGENNCTKNCLFSKEFKIYDFNFLVNTIISKSNNAEFGCIRTNKVFEELLNILHILYLINEKLNIYEYHTFYLFDKKHNNTEGVNTRNTIERETDNTSIRNNTPSNIINIKEEYRNYKLKYKSFVNYPYVLPLELKAELIKLENGDIMKNQLQDTFFRSLFEGEKEPYAFITVGRDSLYEDTIDFIMKQSTGKNNQLRKQIKVIFKGEEGVDSGGMTKEFFQLLSEEIINDDRLFNMKNNFLSIKRQNNNKKEGLKTAQNSYTIKQLYNAVGKILGIALYNDVVLNIPFPTFLFKKILNKSVRMEDLEEIDPMVYISLMNLLKVKNIDELNLNFEITVESDTTEDHYKKDYYSVELIENGKNIPVTNKNINKFISLYVNYLTYESIKEPLEQIKNGFFDIIKHSTVLYLQPIELERIIVGTYFNLDSIKENAVYNGYTKNSTIVKHFWSIFENYSSDNKNKLLKFITGHDRIPISNNPFTIVIMKNGCDTDRLPSSQTCFNTFLLPEYNSKKKLKDKLDIAINMTKGFYLL